MRTLRDRQEFSDDDGEAEKLGIHEGRWALFGVVWDAGLALAHLMADFDVEGKRILEVGCGIGLASLLLNERDADITATDRHPEAGRFLAYNTALNEADAIPFVRADWTDDEDALGEFDLIIGSDVLYEVGHAKSLAGFIDRHSRANCETIIIDAKRGQAARFKRAMAEHGYEHHDRTFAEETLSSEFRGKVHGFTRVA